MKPSHVLLGDRSPKKGRFSWSTNLGEGVGVGEGEGEGER